MSPTDTFDDFVTAEEAMMLPLRGRIEWAVLMCEQVLNLYSPHFLSKYHQTDAFRSAWQFIRSGQYDLSAIGKMLTCARYGDTRAAKNRSCELGIVTGTPLNLAIVSARSMRPCSRLSIVL